MGYQIPVFEELVVNYEAELHVVHWDHKKLTPYVPKKIDKVHYYNRSELDYSKMMKLSKEIQPNLIFVSGWMDSEYLKICKKLKKSGIRVVAGCDTQWKGTLKQRLGSVIFPLLVRPALSKIWVSGVYQYEYARKLGFKKDEIIFNCYSANVKLFNASVQCRKRQSFKRFLFLGRFENVKGIQTLLSAWEITKNPNNSTLTFIGNGSLKDTILQQKNVCVKDFIQPKELSKELGNYDFLILPSLHEPWALVIHEAMAAGLPVICTDVCGAAVNFIISDYNGFLFKPKDVHTLKSILEKLISLDNNRLEELSKNALNRSKLITPEITAASLMSALH